MAAKLKKWGEADDLSAEFREPAFLPHSKLERPPLRGWLLILCVALLVWSPLQLALVSATALGALAIRGLPVGLILLLRIAATALGVAAGMALAARQPAAIRLTGVSLAISAAVDVFVLTTPHFPDNRMPGDTPFYVTASLAYYGAWLAYLARSRRVKTTFK